MKSNLFVNNVPIPAQTVETELNRLVRALSPKMPADELRKQLPLLESQAREHAVNRQLLLDEALRRKTEVTDEEVELIFTNLAGQHPDRAAFELSMKASNTSPELVRGNIRNARLVEKLIAIIIAAVPRPTDEEVLSYLKEAVPEGGSPNPDLIQKLTEKTRRLVRSVRQNQALTKFIADLREKAVIEDKSPADDSSA